MWLRAGDWGGRADSGVFCHADHQAVAGAGEHAHAGVCRVIASACNPCPESYKFVRHRAHIRNRVRTALILVFHELFNSMHSLR